MTPENERRRSRTMVVLGVLLLAVIVVSAVQSTMAQIKVRDQARTAARLATCQALGHEHLTDALLDRDGLTVRSDKNVSLMIQRLTAKPKAGETTAEKTTRAYIELTRYFTEVKAIFEARAKISLADPYEFKKCIK